MQQNLQSLTKGMSDEQLKVAKAAYDTAKAYSEAAAKAGQMADEAERANVAQRDASSKKFGTQMTMKTQNSADLSAGLAGADLIREAQNMIGTVSDLGGVGNEVDRVKASITAYSAELKKAQPDAQTLTDLSNQLRTAMEGLNTGA